MRAFALAVLCLIAAAPVSSQSVSPPSADETAVRAVVGLHQLIAPLERHVDPTVDVGEPFGRQPSALAESAIHGSGVAVLEVFDHHVEGPGHRFNPCPTWADCRMTRASPQCGADRERWPAPFLRFRNVNGFSRGKRERRNRGFGAAAGRSGVFQFRVNDDAGPLAFSPRADAEAIRIGTPDRLRRAYSASRLADVALYRPPKRADASMALATDPPSGVMTAAFTAVDGLIPRLPAEAGSLARRGKGLVALGKASDEFHALVRWSRLVPWHAAACLRLLPMFPV